MNTRKFLDKRRCDIVRAPIANAAYCVASWVCCVLMSTAVMAVQQDEAKILLDFSRARDVNSWNAHEGLQPVYVPTAEGRGVMEIETGTVVVSYLLPRDWRGYSHVEIEAEHSHSGAVEIEMALANETWLDNPESSSLLVHSVSFAAGKQHLLFPLVQAPGRVFDFGKVIMVRLSVRGPKGIVRIHQLRLTGAAQRLSLVDAPGLEVEAFPHGLPASSSLRNNQETVVLPDSAPPLRPDGTWLGFETDVDVQVWEVRAGPMPERVPRHATQGLFSLRLAPGTLLATETVPRDWTGWDTFLMDVVNETERPIPLEVVLGDDAWLGDQHYWNRHNSLFTLVPGSNRVEIALAGLFRGEAGARNTGSIKRPIDLESIAFMSMAFHGKPAFGDLYIDHVRFEGAGEKKETDASNKDAPIVFGGSDMGATNVWLDVEEPRDLARWEVREGPMCVLSPLHATRGSHSLLVHPGTLIATRELPTDWSGHEAMEFDVVNTGRTIQKLEVLVGDQAWLGAQNYWNRHNAMFVLVPGLNTISLPVDGLYRGEASARERGTVKGPLDPKRIAFLSLKFHGPGEAPCHVDHFRLVGGKAVEASVAGDVSASADSSPVPAVPDEEWMNFSDRKAIGRWKTRQGPAVQVVDAPEGGPWMQMLPGNLVVHWSPPRDWARHETMEFEVFNPGETLARLELVVGDEAWLAAPDYWNRHNVLFTIPPGLQTLRVPVGGMWRGEASARGRGTVPGNLHATHITFMSMTYHAAKGESPLLVGSFWLRASPPRSANTSLRGFDFGPNDQALWSGFQAVSWDTVYDTRKGYGLDVAQSRASFAGDSTYPTRLLQDWVSIERGGFRVDLPNGTYRVAVFFEDGGYWGGEQALFSRRSILANGREVHSEDRSDRPVHAESHFRFEDVEPGPNDDVQANAFKVLYPPRVFDVTIDHGFLQLGFQVDARRAARVSAIVIGEDQPSGSFDLRIADLLAQNLREVRTRFAGEPLPKPAPLHGFDESLLAKPFLAWTPAPSARVMLTDTPPLDRVGWHIPTLSIPQGGGDAVSFVLHGLRDDVRVSVKYAPSDDASDVLKPIPEKWVQLYSVRHIAKRTLGDPVYRIIPWHLGPASEQTVGNRQNRQFWGRILVPSDAEPGGYSGHLLVTGNDGTRSVFPFHIEVLPFSLDPPQFSFSFFGMPEEALELFAAVGANAPSGGSRVRMVGFDSAGEAILDTTDAERFIARARAAGMDRPIMDYAGPMFPDGMNPENAQEFFAALGRNAGLSAEESAKRLLIALRTHAQRAGWGGGFMSVADEPLHAEQTLRLIASARFLKQADPDTRLGGYFGFSPSGDRARRHELFAVLDDVATKGYTHEVMETAQAGGKNIYLYSLGRSRHVYGPVMARHARAGIAGYMLWHAFIVHGYQFYDLDGREPDDSLVVLRSDGFWPTLDLEEIRLGIQDFRALRTLERLSIRHPDLPEAVEGLRISRSEEVLTAATRHRIMHLIGSLRVNNN